MVPSRTAYPRPAVSCGCCGRRAVNKQRGATVQRYATAAERSYFRARRELQQGRSREFRNKAKEAQAWLQSELRKPVPPERLGLEAALNEPDWPAADPIAAAPDPTIAVPVYFPPDSDPNRQP